MWKTKMDRIIMSELIIHSTAGHFHGEAVEPCWTVFFFLKGTNSSNCTSCWNQLFSLILTAGGMLVLYFGSLNGYHFCCGVGGKPNLNPDLQPPPDSRLGSQEVQATFYISENWIKCVTAFKLHLIFNWNQQLHVGLLSSSFFATTRLTLLLI